MAPSFLLTNYSKLTAVKTILLSRTVINRLTGNPFFSLDDWPKYVTSLQELGQNTDRLESAHHAALNHDSIMIGERNEHNVRVQGNLSTIAKHLELRADGNINALKTTGFPFRKIRTKSSAVREYPLPQLTMKHGKMTGTLTGKVAMPAGVKSIIVEITDGDPTVEANWRMQGTYGSGSFEITGLQAGKSYSFRVRYVTSNGTGPASNPFTLMSL
jgi:hypothetical protein